MKQFAENPARAFRRLGVTLPLRLSGSEVGEVLDDKGAKVLNVDPDGKMQDDAADEIAAYVVLTVNAVTAFFAIAELAGGRPADAGAAGAGGQG